MQKTETKEEFLARYPRRDPHTVLIHCSPLNCGYSECTGWAWECKDVFHFWQKPAEDVEFLGIFDHNWREFIFPRRITPRTTRTPRRVIWFKLKEEVHGN